MGKTFDKQIKATETQTAARRASRKEGTKINENTRNTMDAKGECGEPQRENKRHERRGSANLEGGSRKVRKIKNTKSEVRPTSEKE
jgi:hypothetical protein